MGGEVLKRLGVLASGLMLFSGLLLPIPTLSAPTTADASPGVGIQWDTFRNFTINELMVFELPKATSVIVEPDGTVALLGSEVQARVESNTLQAAR